MIIFEGSISGQCLKNCNKKLRIECLWGFSFACFVSALIWYLIFGLTLDILIPIALFFSAFLICYFIVPMINKKTFKITIDIDEQTVIYNAINRDEQFFVFDDIKSIYDYGEYYHIWQGDLFLCQKNLLTEGSIEEFEKIFEDKIIRKY